MPERAFQCTPAAGNRDRILNSVSWEAEYLFRRLALECDRYWRVAVDGEHIAHSIRCTCFTRQRRFRAWNLPKIARHLNELMAAGIVRRFIQRDRCWVEGGDGLRYVRGSAPAIEPARGAAGAESAGDALRIAQHSSESGLHWRGVLDRVGQARELCRMRWRHMPPFLPGAYGLPAIQAAKIRQMVMKPEKIIGTMKKYFQLKNVTTTKHAAKPQVTSGMVDRDSLGSPPSCHARIAAKTRRTVTKSPKPV